MSEIKKLILNKNWDLLIKKYSTEKICSLLNFNEAMRLTKHLFYEDFCNNANQQFVLKLAFEIKNHFNNEWENDWENDVFLGNLCSLLWFYDEQYFNYKKAYDKLKDPPAELLLLLSDCKSALGTPPITDEESEFYLK